MTEKQRNLIIRSITGTLFVAIMVCGLLRIENMLFLFALITGLCVWEFCGLINNTTSATVNKFICTAAGVYFFMAVTSIRAAFLPNFIVFVPYLLTLIYLFVSELFLSDTNPVQNWAYTALSQMYIALPLAMINILAIENQPNGIHYDMLLPLSVFIFLWTSDTGAYCCGSLFGRHKLFARISPAKTWEGSIGGGILVLLVAGGIGWWVNSQTTHSLNIIEWMGLGLVVTLFGTLGDLVESLFKRTIGIKDSGSILPGHGGMLDRFDSSLIAIPAAVIYIYTLQIL